MKHYKQKMIEDDKELGEIDDYIGPGIFISLALVIIGFLVLAYGIGKVFIS